ncbi:MAG: lysoplasmalogenase [Defluviitaleaceae bacterium]|nr:lysoplasmalogenase [Defluviitaleaceae bacterium]MCL2240244.1 lysoplasmalogenase [Defluviitaleaceae bacterium]
MTVFLPLLALLILFAIHDFIKYRSGENLPAALLKGGCTAVCLLVFILRITPAEMGLYAVVFIAAIALCIAADIIICFRFNPGVILFGLAHVFYIAAFSFGGLRLLPFALSAVASFAVMLYFVWRWGLLSREKSVYSIYLALLATMLGLSFSRGGWLPLGAIAFTTSDIILIYCRFIYNKEWLRRFNLALYFAGIFLLALFY